MKANFLLSAAVITLLTAAAHAQTINWGSEVYSDLRDSHGTTLTGDFTFELGAFVLPDHVTAFTPTALNMADWFTNWVVFDTAAYNPTFNYFTSTVDMTDTGRSSDAPSGLVNFSGRDAYVWIHYGTVPNSSATEWLLVRDTNTSALTDPATNWIFPTANTHCCDPDLPLEWSVTDLTSTDLPKYGYQTGTNQGDTYTKTGTGDLRASGVEGSYVLQTASFTSVPELSSSVLVLILGILGLTDRRRSWRA